VYEICFRARASLPFVSHAFINFIIQCVVARVQRDDKVILCHDIWNGSHPHLIVVSKDAQQVVNFYSEIQKKVTDILKRLLGLSFLQIWEGNVSVIKLGDVQAVKERISYLYANPAQDNLEDNIEKFPGLSSWKDFQECLQNIDGSTLAMYPWLRLPSIPIVSSGSPSESEGLDIIGCLKASNKVLHALKRQPNAWMRSFGIHTSREATSINGQIVEMLREREKVARLARIQERKPFMGARLLMRQPLLKPHTPKRREGKIYIITTSSEVRIEHNDRVERFRQICRKCYERWKRGEFSVLWPPEAFKPPMPPTFNLFAT